MGPTTGTPTVLIVDDDAAIIESMQLLLELQGYNVLTSYGPDAVEQIKNTQVDVVLLDVWMGQIDGREVCKAVKKHPAIASTPIILVSASKDNRETVTEVGANAFIQKPFDIDTVIEVVEECLHTRS